MQDLFRSGLVADVILMLMAAEASALAIYRKVTGRGPALADIAAMLLAGACLVLALRAGLTGQAWPVVAMFLLAALVAHLMDLYRRWLGTPRKL